jgi:hypothetical protein
LGTLSKVSPLTLCHPSRLLLVGRGSGPMPGLTRGLIYRAALRCHLSHRADINGTLPAGVYDWDARAAYTVSVLWPAKVGGLLSIAGYSIEGTAMGCIHLGCQKVKKNSFPRI